MSEDTDMTEEQIQELGRKIGESMVPAYIKFAEDVKKAEPNQRRFAAMMNLRLVQRLLEKDIYCPLHQDNHQHRARLTFSCGHTVEEVLKEFKDQLSQSEKVD